MSKLGPKTSSIKIVLVGPSNAGKTSIAKRFTTDQFDEFQDMTVGSAFFSKQVHAAKHGTSARVEVWDTAGQEKYRAMAPMYFRNAAGALLVFDQTAPSSFDDIEKIWLPELLPHMKNSTQFIAMCANKADAAEAFPEATEALMARVRAMCSSRGIALFPTSAKTGQNIGEVFGHLVDEILDGRIREQSAAKADRATTIAQPISVASPVPPRDNSAAGPKCCNKS
jgi:small GTP-binding protein